jgi:Raf kinase inhibitor-like YbhB/YbcL family protein
MNFPRFSLVLASIGSLLIGSAAMASDFKLHVTGVHDGAVIAKEYTADGSDYSPALSYENVPANAKSVAITVTDPDAPRGTWWHLVAVNFPPHNTSLKKGDLDAYAKLPAGANLGFNDFDKLGYNGPSPPPGKPHRYYFRVYALDKLIPNYSGRRLDKVTFEENIKGHVLAQAEAVGTYKR